MINWVTQRYVASNTLIVTKLAKDSKGRSKLTFEVFSLFVLILKSRRPGIPHALAKVHITMFENTLTDIGNASIDSLWPLGFLQLMTLSVTTE